MKGKQNWEHLTDELHVLITVEDTKNRAEVKLRRAVEEIKRLLVPAVSEPCIKITQTKFEFFMKHILLGPLSLVSIL
jgi:protein quaking